MTHLSSIHRTDECFEIRCVCGWVGGAFSVGVALELLARHLREEAVEICDEVRFAPAKPG